MRSVEQILFDLAADPEFVTALLTKIAKLTCDCLTAALREAGEYIDIVVTGDDVASQAGPMMSPAMYRRLIKPHHARMFAAIRENTKAKTYLHSCGNVYKLIGDFIDVGVELLNPVQVSAGEMGDTARLKREFGDRLSFLGGIDTQWALPFGTTGRRQGGSPPTDPRSCPQWRIYRSRRPLPPARRASRKCFRHVRGSGYGREVSSASLTRANSLTHHDQYLVNMTHSMSSTNKKEQTHDPA